LTAQIVGMTRLLCCFVGRAGQAGRAYDLLMERNICGK